LVPRSDQSITLFESQGIALEDITVAYHIYCRALQERRVKTIDGLPS
jgi:ornithine cyclodeaminase/alanine dehydrogenase-like protein (mu-crystallin family)